MKSRTAHILLFVAGLVLLAAAQDAVPPLGGAKPPFVLAFALYFPFRRRLFPSLAAAAFAGAFVEAMDSPPFGSAIGFFAAAALVVQAVRRAVALPPAALGALSVPVAAAAFELWRRMWSSAPGAAGALATLLPATLAGAALFAALPALERFAGLDGAEREAAE